MKYQKIQGDILAEKLTKLTIEQIHGITDIRDIKLDIDHEDLYNSLVFGRLLGQYLAILSQKEASEVKEFAQDINIFAIPFLEAIRSLIEKEPKLAKELEKIKKDERLQYFWIKLATNLEQTKRIQQEIIKGLEKGLSVFGIIREIEDNYLLLGERATSRYWKQAIDMNLANAQSRGNWERMNEIKDEGFKYARYTAIVDGRETDLCHGLNGKVMSLEDFKSNGLVPPLHYGCRSTLVQLNDKEVTDEEGNYRKHIKVADEDTIRESKKKRQKGFGKILKDDLKEIKKLVKDKEREVKSNDLKIGSYQN